MIEHPILFSGPMVRAILEGRKGQTRRVVVQPRRKDGAKLLPELLQKIGVGHASPYGVPGDRLWVRENYRMRRIAVGGGDLDRVPTNMIADSTRWYEADGKAPNLFGKLRPSIHLPRVYCRLVLEVTRVRIERLMDITEADASAEGVVADPCCCIAYRRLWDSLNEKRGYGWKVNPWVWVVEFKQQSGDVRQQ